MRNAFHYPALGKATPLAPFHRFSIQTVVSPHPGPTQGFLPKNMIYKFRCKLVRNILMDSLTVPILSIH